MNQYSRPRRGGKDYQTPQLPPNPTVTVPPSTMTGTARFPFECRSISFIFSASASTSTYWNATFRRA